MKQPCVYIIASNSLCLYVGITSNLPQRLYQHKEKLVTGFSQKYNCTRLLYYEPVEEMLSAIEREKQIKKWNRAKKLKLIEINNPRYKDLSEEFL